MERTKVAQESVIKQSLVEPPRQLDPQFRVDEKGNPVSEQEILEQRQRLADRERAAAELADRRARWAGKTRSEVLRQELERIRPGISGDDTFSIAPKTDTSIDIHLMGRVFRIMPHVVKHSDETFTWHITAQGALDRLRTAAVRPDVPREVKQGDIYEEQADMLRELAKAGGILEDPDLEAQLQVVSALGTSSIRWKSEVQTLFLFLIKRLQEIRCQSSQPQPQPQPRQHRKKPTGPKAPPRRRRKAEEPVSLESRDALAEADSRTTSPS